jgi:SNF2 family DNA or RNA helicase
MKLREYQLRTIKFLHEQKNAILSVGMGLGKTAAVLHYIDEVKPETVLIVAPKRVATTVWRQEAINWGLSDVAEKMVVVDGSPKKRSKLLEDKSKPYKVIGRDNMKDVEGYCCDVLVLDELTSFKNHDTKRSKICYGITAKQKIGLTGTFTGGDLTGIWGQAHAVGVFTDKRQNFWAWRATFFYNVMEGSKQRWQKWKLRKEFTIDDLLKPIRKNIFTLDSADYLEIPEVSYHLHNVELTNHEMNEYMRLKTMLHIDMDGVMFSVKEQAKFAKLQTVVNGFLYDAEGTAFRSKYSTKMDEVVEFVERAVGEGEHVLLWYSFREEAIWLAEKLKKLDISFCSSNDKRFIEKWNSGEVDVLMMHPASGGHGLNLQHGGHIAVWSSITYSLELWLQANARLARQGQTEPVQIHVFSAVGTIEVDQYKSLMTKNKIEQEFLELTK